MVAEIREILAEPAATTVFVYASIALAALLTIAATWMVWPRHSGGNKHAR